MKLQVREHFRRPVGATASELIIIIVLVALVIMASVKMFQGNLGTKVELANDQVASVSTESDEERRLRERGRQADQARAQREQSSKKRGQDEEAEKVARGEEHRRKHADLPDHRPQAGAAAQPSCGGFNPFLIPIVLGLLGLLGYVIAKSKKG